MTDHEVRILTELATDMKWLKCAIEENAQANTAGHNKIITHLEILNWKTNKNTVRSIVNRYSILGAFVVEGIIITILLHLMGVY